MASLARSPLLLPPVAPSCLLPGWLLPFGCRGGAEGGRRRAESGKRKAESGKQKADDGRRKAELASQPEPTSWRWSAIATPFDLRPISSRSRHALVAPPTAATTLHSNSLDQSCLCHGFYRGAAIPAQGCHWRHHQGHHDHHWRRRFRLGHSEHPHQAERRRSGHLHQDRQHHCSLRYARLWTSYTTLAENMSANRSTTGAMGGAYEFAKCASANLRRKDDSWNPAIGGFFAGSMLGLRCTPPLLRHNLERSS